MTPRVYALLAVLLTLVGYLGYVLYTKPVPCVTPITYSITEFDSRFGVSRDELTTDLAQAAAVWNTELGRDVFIVSDKPELPILVRYGALKRAVDTLSTLSDSISQAKLEETKTANEYATLKKQFDIAQRQGNATQAMADQLNVLLKKYYTLHDQVSADVAKSNNAVPQGDIDEGEYVSDKQGTRIYMYGFQNKIDLMRGLIHEFGHALGLGHVANVDSIMYPLNKSTSLVLSPEDKAELQKACSRK